MRWLLAFIAGFLAQGCGLDAADSQFEAAGETSASVSRSKCPAGQKKVDGRCLTRLSGRFYLARQQIADSSYTYDNFNFFKAGQNRLNFITRYYREGVAEDEVEVVYDVVVRGRSKDVAGAAKVDFVTTAIAIRDFNPDAIEFYNETGRCGRTNWRVGKRYLFVKGADCYENERAKWKIGKRIKTLNLIKDDVLYTPGRFWDDESRPTRVDRSSAAKQYKMVGCASPNASKGFAVKKGDRGAGACQALYCNDGYRLARARNDRDTVCEPYDN